MRIFITGITGQDGHYLAKAALTAGHEVIGMVRGQDNPRFEQVPQGVELVKGDLLDAQSLWAALLQASPVDAVVNLGAITFVPFSWGQPELTFDTNTLGVQRLMQVSADFAVKRFVQASTSEMFGTAGAHTQYLNEGSAMHPSSPYAVSKLAAHHLCRTWRNAGRLDAVCAISFNHESPLRPLMFVTRKIIQQAIAVKRGLQEYIELSDLRPERDWGWAPEYMEGILKLATAPKLISEAYVLATGVSASVGDFARYALELLDLDTKAVYSSGEPRPGEVWALRGDSTRIKRELGWAPSYAWKDVCRMMMEAELGQEA